MSTLPPIPPEQRQFAGDRPDRDKPAHDRRDDKTELQSGEPGDADTNLNQQGRQANTRQNLTPQRKVQDR